MIDQLKDIVRQIDTIINYFKYNNSNNDEKNGSSLLEHHKNINKEFQLFKKDIDKMIYEIEIFFNKKRNEIFNFDQDESVMYCRNLRLKIDDLNEKCKRVELLDDVDKVFLIDNILEKIKKLRKNFNSYYRMKLGLQSQNKNNFKEIEDIKEVIEKRYENDSFFFKNRFKEILDLNQNKVNELVKILDNSLRESNIKNDKYLDKNNEKLNEILSSYQNNYNTLTQNLAEQKSSMKNTFEEFMIEADSIRGNYVSRFSTYFSEIQEGWEKIQQIKTENVYLNAYKKNNIRARLNEKKFIQILYLSLFISLILILSFIFNLIDFQVFITLKFMVLIFFGILVAYYLKLASHYRRLADQAEQTHLELLAFPQYVASLEPQKTNEIKEQLALKYFGKDLDSKGYEKMGDLVQEQLKTSVELVKAVATISSHHKLSDNVGSKPSPDTKSNFNKVG